MTQYEDYLILKGCDRNLSNSTGKGLKIQNSLGASIQV